MLRKQLGGERRGRRDWELSGKALHLFAGHGRAGSADCSSYSLPPGCTSTDRFPEAAGIKRSTIVIIEESRVLGGGAG